MEKHAFLIIQNAYLLIKRTQHALLVDLSQKLGRAK